MILRLLFILLFLIAFLPISYAQIENREGRILSPTFPGGIVEISELPPPKTKGSTYIYDTWNLGSIALKSEKSVRNIPLKYDLYNNYLEVSSDKGIKVIYSEKIKYFEWLNAAGKTETFYNVDEFSTAEEINGSFFEVLHGGKFILAAIKEIDYVSPHYNQALDAGNEEGRYVTKEKFYYIDQNNFARKIPKKKKNFYKIFGDTATDIETYMKSKNYGLKDKYELIKIFEYCDRLESGT